MTRVLPCVLCGKQLENVSFAEDEDINQPYGGTVFTSYGHYGSTVFDEMGRRYLEVTFCDPCLVKMGEAGRVQVIVSYNPPPEIVSSKRWSRAADIAEDEAEEAAYQARHARKAQE